MTDTTRQTPGPWRLTQVHTPEDAYGNWYFSIKSGKGFHDEDEQGFELTGLINPKDAHIAAAAPELLLAIEELLNAYSKPDERLCCDGRDCGCMGSTVHQQAEHYARVAVAKARGAA